MMLSLRLNYIFLGYVDDVIFIFSKIEMSVFIRVTYLMFRLNQHTGTNSSVAVLAEIPLRSPQKIFIFIIKK